MNNKSNNNLLSLYPAFSFLKWMKKINIVSLPVQNLFFTIFFILLLSLSSYLDKSLILDEPNIGLFQHPAIWMFFLIQAIVPFFISKSIESFLNMPKWKYNIISKSFFDNNFKSEIISLKKDISRKSIKSQSVFAILFFIGAIAFIWNSYQNQNPLKFLGFDFWDSYSYTYGYWTTRLYKFYIWCFFFPSIVHLYSFVIAKILSILKLANNNQLLKIEPYHYDNNGGVSIIIINIIRPIIPILFITSLLSIIVLTIHNKIDVTSLSSLIIATLLLLLFYFIPVITIRSIIKKEKEKQLAEISNKQEKILNSITSNNDVDFIRKNYEIIDILSSVSHKIKAIPNWPNYKLMVKIISIAYCPTVLNFIIKFLVFKFLQK